MLEDAAAVSGVTVAAICTWLAHSTGNMFFDGLGSVLVGTLLGATALFLIQNNRRLLIGRAMSPNEAARVLKYLEKDSVVAAVFDAKSEELGPGIFRFKAEIAFSGDTVVDRHVLKNPAKAELIKSIREVRGHTWVLHTLPCLYFEPYNGTFMLCGDSNHHGNNVASLGCMSFARPRRTGTSPRWTIT